MVSLASLFAQALSLFSHREVLSADGGVMTEL